MRNAPQSLYEKHPDTFARLKSRGFRSVAQMAQFFTRPVDMDRALGMVSACAKWVTEENLPRISTEHKAKQWLKINAHKMATASQPEATHQDPYLKHCADLADALKTPKSASTGIMLLVVTTIETAPRAKKMLQLLGCEVEEI